MTLIRLTGLGAVSDAQMMDSAVMASGLPLLTIAAGPFTAGDVGKSIVVAGAGAGGAKLKTSIATFVSATQVTLAANAATAVSGVGIAWGTDCSAALQAAIDQVDAERGGTILVDGYFLLTEPVARAFFATVTTSYMRLLGSGTDSALIVAVDSGETAITLSSLVVDVERISFVGIPNAGADARRVLSFTGGIVSLRRCQFLGLATTDQTVYFADGWSTLEGNQFGGTFTLAGGSAGVARSVVYNADWYGFDDHSSQFIDYGYWRGLLLSKSGLGSVSAWVGLGSPNASFVEAGARVAGIATFRDTRLDEGSLRGIWAEGLASPIPSVALVGSRHNVSAVEGSSGIYAKSVGSVLVDRCVFGLASDPGTALGRFADCGRVEIDSLTLLQGVDKIVASNVDALIVRDTVVDSYDLTGTAFYPESSAAGGLALVKLGAVTDSDFPTAPGQGAQALDKLNGRLYVRASGDWIYFNMDGGSLLGPELVPNGTGGSTAGWTASNATLSSVGGRLRVTNTASGGRALETVPVEIGREYRFSVEIISGSAVARVGTTPSGGEYFVKSIIGGSTTFVATTSTVHIALICSADPAGLFAEFDNISLRAT